MSDKWSEYREKFCGCKDASRLNSCKGLSNCELRPEHPERKPATDGHIKLIEQVEKAQKEMDLWPESWKSGLKLVLMRLWRKS